MAKKSPYESGALTDSIFLILLATLEPIHGYKIMQTIQHMTNGDVEIGPATMYTTLKKLSNSNWIHVIDDDEAKIMYKITDKGRKVLLQNYYSRKKIIEIAENILLQEEI